ncbi:hypothetical protein RND71_010778 [Anisodus tanguticus]|uniref:Reverse transcriptase domain-containing protein n=1 Tax=Anisodus tanguticus TaxID=243964 RepID=A0AAE1VIF3_9SOLA|nr:hypothetical protein RND71_010778 [Anisodus tanguticus]
MEYIGFPEQFLGWIFECIQTVNYAILVNGESTVPFNAAKGLRQGDPISSSLFAIAMEYLSINLRGLKDIKEFHYHPKCSRLGLTHLSFADDLLLFARGDLPSVSALHQCCMQFSEASGLQENMTKSSVYCGGMSQMETETIIQHLGFVKGDLPSNYLGVPLSTKKLSILQWQPLVHKILARITSRMQKNWHMQEEHS